MTDLFNMLMSLDSHDNEDHSVILRAPFNYPGGKSRIARKIANALPPFKAYVEPFGGSAAVLLARKPVALEIYNDRYGGVVALYRVLRDPNKYQELMAKCECTIHSREDWYFCKQTWQNPHLDDVERAFRWIYMVKYSFGGLARNFGRDTSAPNSTSGKIRSAARNFHTLHQRFTKVLVENRDYWQCMRDYDSADTLFYLDPPYLETDPSCYSEKFRLEDHQQLLQRIQLLKGAVAISSYKNDVYDAVGWDDIHVFDAPVAIVSGTDSSYGVAKERYTAQEVLYIRLP